MKVSLSRIWSVFCLASVAFGLISNEVEAANSGVVVTWEGGFHSLPGSATRSGENEDISFIQNNPKSWSDRVQKDYLKPDVTLPAVIYLHGCSGPRTAQAWAQDFNGFGFAFFAPNSFARPGRVAKCSYRKKHNKRNRRRIHLQRREELRYALQQIKRLPWIDKKRLVLVGFSEGGHAAAAFNGVGFTAHILLGTDCRTVGRKPRAPNGVAVLNIVGSKDRYGYGRGCAIRRNIRGSKSVVLRGAGHNIQGRREAVTAVTKFLNACCGYKPENATAGLNADAAAKKLVEELGGMATFDAMMKADEALGKGDEKGHAFWMRVYEIATKLSGG